MAACMTTGEPENADDIILIEDFNSDPSNSNVMMGATLRIGLFLVCRGG